jgi:hypothetical protein
MSASVERQIVETDIDEKPEARGDCLEKRFGDCALARAETLGRSLPGE